jgi:hypothetical protein
MMRPYYPVSRYTRRQFRAQAAMLRLLAGMVLAALLAMALLASDLAQAAQPGLRFDGGIGSQPWARNGAGALVPNDVFGVLPGGRPWVIERLVASVDASGNIKVEGRGLLLAGGNAVGRNGGQSVRARLICNDGAAVTSTHETTLTPLAANGDFSFNEPLLPQPAATCGNPVLLIVNTGGAWFAAGIPKD